MKVGDFRVHQPGGVEVGTNEIIFSVEPNGERKRIRRGNLKICVTRTTENCPNCPAKDVCPNPDLPSVELPSELP